MHSLQENDWVPAKVPGSVYQAYLDAGKMDDPFYRDNEEKALNLMKQDFEFATTFDAKEALREADRTVLHFDGIDTLGEIYLNGTHLGDTENMHREWEFDVKELLKAEGNELRVILRSPVNYIYDSYEKDPLSVDCSDAMKGCSRLRKAHCMFGWDWGPRLPDAGIFREVKLLGITKARFDNVRISQKHVDGQVDLALFVGTETVTESPEPFAYRVTLTTPEGKSEVYGNSPASIHVEKPELWWPNGYGKQNLYGVKIELLDGEKVLDVWEKRIGLRTMTVAREKDQWGECFCHEVNGVRIFAMGADYIPEDNVLPRVTPERTRQLLTDARDCHFNCIRVWGGGYYPDDFFYDICRITDAGCIHNIQRYTLQTNIFLQNISGCSGNISYNCAILSKQCIKQRRFTCIGLTYNYRINTLFNNTPIVRRIYQLLNLLYQRFYYTTKCLAIPVYTDVLRIIKSCLYKCSMIQYLFSDIYNLLLNIPL